MLHHRTTDPGERALHIAKREVRATPGRRHGPKNVRFHRILETVKRELAYILAEPDPRETEADEIGSMA